ncbi:MAG: hypothetical protein FWH07_00110 [Oscillospiraceae bacterium]|nr:hypothetical protein [Oscillospiraceae bacterium]
MESNKDKAKIGELPYDVLLSLYLVMAALSIFLSKLIVAVLMKPKPLDVERIEQLYSWDISQFYSNSHEMNGLLLYIVLICAFTVLFTIGARLLYNKTAFTPSEKWLKLASFSAPLLCAAGLFAVVYSLIELMAYDDGFYAAALSVKLDYSSTIAAFSVISAFWILYNVFYRVSSRPDKPNFSFDLKKYMLIVSHVFAVVVILYAASFFINNSTNPGSSRIHAHHYAVVFNPVYEVQNGKTLGVDLKVLYGFYAYFFWAVETFLFGKVSVWATTLLMGVLVVISNSAIYVILCKMLKNRVIAVLALLSIIFFTELFPLSYQHMTFFQYTPIRLLFPVLTMLFITLFQVYNKKRHLFLFASAAAAIGLLWNPESGIVSILSLIAYSAYISAESHYINSVGFWKLFGKRLGIVVVTVFAAVLTLMGFTFVRSGEILDIAGIFWSIKSFAGDGFFMLPLPQNHPYVIVMLVYSLALIFTVARLKLFRFGTQERQKHRHTGDNSLLFTLGIMGFGLVSYFFGRSHPFVFALCLWPVFIVIALFCDRLMTVWSEGSRFSVPTRCVFGAASGVMLIGLFFVGFSVFTLNKSDGFRLYNERRKGWDVVVSAGVSEFVFTHRAENMAFIDEYSPFIMSHLGLKNEYNGIAAGDLLLKQDHEEVVQFIRDYEGRLFIAQNIFMQQISLSEGRFDELIAETLQNDYLFVTHSHGIWVYDRL